MFSPRKVAKVSLAVVAASTIGVAVIVPGIICLGAVRITGHFCKHGNKKIEHAKVISLMMATGPICVGMLVAS
jgi:hypothetical protein